jgi:hypothetical protein
MEGREKPHMVKYKAITNDWNYDASCTLTSFPVCDLKDFKRLVFVVQSVQTVRTSVVYMTQQEVVTIIAITINVCNKHLD